MHLSRSLIFAVFSSVLLVGSASATNLDKALLEKAPDVLAPLLKQDLKVVGVLPFQVKRGTRKASFTDSPLTNSLPARLETALIIRNPGDVNKPGSANEVLVIRSASNGAAWASNEAAFKKLFDTEFLPAWGDKKVKAKAFLTGVVSNEGDRKNTKIDLHLVTPTSWKDGKFSPAPLLSFEVKTDRALLRDLGYNIAIFHSRGLKKEVTRDDLDDDSTGQVALEDSGKIIEPGPKTEGSHNLEDVAGMKFEVEYDGVKQEIKAVAGPAGAQQKLYELVAPKPGQKVVMYLTRVSDAPETLGVVLKINGQSSFEQQTDDPLACRKWLYPISRKDKRDDIRGWYTEGADRKLKVRPFKALTDAEAAEKALEFDVRVGWIDIDVFTTRGADEPVADELTISTRSIPKGRFKDLDEAQQELAKSNRIQISNVNSRSIGGVLYPEAEPADAGTVKREGFPNPVRLGGISIRYLEQREP